MSDTQTRVTYISALFVLTIAMAACTPVVEPAPAPAAPTGQEAPAVQEAPSTEAPANTPEKKDTSNAPEGEETKEINQTYSTPGGEETAHFIFTLNGSKVSKVGLDITSTNEVTQKMQSAFAGGINAIVAGKDLADIEDLDVVSGSSLTPGAFNQAMEQLRTQI